ncbi:MAG TPA: C39 family peptidase [Nevskiaceae bacterium]|nr:C39 family peptidase [Nevskiaceae bacterium]
MHTITRYIRRTLLLSVASLFVLTPVASAATPATDYDKKAIYGASPFYDPNYCGPSGNSTNTGGNSSIPYKLPASTGETGREESIDASGRVPSTGEKVSFAKYASLGQAYRDYYITMRWTFASWSWDGHSKIVDSKQLDWFTSGSKPRLVLVTNPRTHKSIVAAALESGPGPSVGTQWRADHGNKSSPAPPYWQGYQVGTPNGYDGLVSGFPPTALDALGATTGYSSDKNPDKLTYQWASDQDAMPGPTNEVAAAQADGSTCGTSGTNAGANGWDLTGTHAMVTYEQYDPKYATHPFGNGNIKDCGCGPTSMAMAIATLTGDKSVTPSTVADYYDTHGGSTGCGSTWNWAVLGNKWDIHVENIGTNLEQARQTIKGGGLVLVSYTGPPFQGSNGGHIFLIRAVTTDGNFYIANPLGHYAGARWADQNTTVWDAKYFSTQQNDKGGFLKNMWAITKK